MDQFQWNLTEMLGLLCRCACMLLFIYHIFGFHGDWSLYNQIFLVWTISAEIVDRFLINLPGILGIMWRCACNLFFLRTILVVCNFPKFLVTPHKNSQLKTGRNFPKWPYCTVLLLTTKSNIDTIFICIVKYWYGHRG